jgi:glycosyltransferase involved in cell wall biosynthesis
MLVDWPSPADPMPGEPPERPIVAYTGGVYRQHVEDFVLGLQGVALAREHCPSLRFVHTGGVGRGIDIHALAERAGLPPESLDLRGYVSAADLDQVLREATLVIQPGRDTPFNRLRLPSKLQRYLALGVPTITFALGAGALLTDDEVLKTHTDQPDELASQIVRLLDDEELRTQLAQAGRKAAKRLFGPEQADALMDYYRAAAGRPGG